MITSLGSGTFSSNNAFEMIQKTVSETVIEVKLSLKGMHDLSLKR